MDERIETELRPSVKAAGGDDPVSSIYTKSARTRQIPMKLSFVIHFMLGFALIMFGGVLIERVTGQTIWKYIIVGVLFFILTIYTQKIDRVSQRVIPFWLGIVILLVFLAAGIWLNVHFVENV
jgi:hypothetical protein